MKHSNNTLVLLSLLLVLAIWACEPSLSPNKVVIPQPEEAAQEPEAPGQPSAVQPEEGDDSSPYRFLSEDAAKSFSDAEKKTVNAMNNFSFDFAREIFKAESKKAIEKERTLQGMIASPLSMAFLLGMESNAVEDDCKRQIARVLGFDEEQEDAMNLFFRDFIVLGTAGNSEKGTLEIANAVFSEISTPVYDSYHERVKNYFDADVVAFDPLKTSGGRLVNEWVNEKTHGRIPSILEDGASFVKLFINAMYFKAQWAIPFDDEYTRKQPFYNAEGKEKEVDMMAMSSIMDTFRFYECDYFKMLTLPYRSKGSMSFLLPREDVSVAELFDILDADTWKRARESSEGKHVHIRLPKFDVETGKDECRNEQLQSLGIKSLFTSNMPKFWEFGNTDHKIYQIASLSLDENGTEAAVVSYDLIEGAPLEVPEFVEFNANRPFVFIISEKVTGALMFIGCFLSPA